MTLEVDVQMASDEDDLPDPADLGTWARAAVGDLERPSELTIRIVDECEGARLNEQFRHKDGATNVLSFPFDPPPEADVPLLGDIVICAPVVRREAAEQSARRMRAASRCEMSQKSGAVIAHHPQIPSPPSPIINSKMSSRSLTKTAPTGLISATTSSTQVP